MAPENMSFLIRVYMREEDILVNFSDVVDIPEVEDNPPTYGNDSTSRYHN